MRFELSHYLSEMSFNQRPALAFNRAKCFSFLSACYARRAFQFGCQGAVLCSNDRIVTAIIPWNVVCRCRSTSLDRQHARITSKNVDVSQLWYEYSDRTFMWRSHGVFIGVWGMAVAVCRIWTIGRSVAV
eukprot:scaffold279692_cov16-Prasinocladus_malaysianus.AAC.1